MVNRKWLLYGVVRACLCMLLFAGAGLAAGDQKHPDFSGHWKQDNDRCQPPRKGDVTLAIDHHDPKLTIETFIRRGDAPPRHAVQLYMTNGKVSLSTGADGDEFHTSIVWAGESLVFTVEEHEDGKIILSRETWTLIENGAALERVREPQDGGGKQTLIYLKQSQ